MKSYAALGELLAEFSQVQILDTAGNADALIAEFLKTRERVSTFSEATQKKIRRAVTPFWQGRYISLVDDDALCVKDLLLSPKFFLQTEFFVDSEPFPKTDGTRLGEALDLADLSREILNRKLISLSNGELRRILLARLWMETPELAYLNDPFGGLDPAFRGKLAQTILGIEKAAMRMVVRLIREDELLPGLPAFVFEAGNFVPFEGELPTELKEVAVESAGDTYEVLELGNAPAGGELLFDLNHVNVQFDETEVIKDLSWQMRSGENWVIMGPNGAGKSTLLALLSGDHPQMYRNDVTLLGAKPGRGLNVWEHKAKIGFFSPELALHYKEKLCLYEVLCSGFSTSLGLFEPPTWAEKEKARAWVKELGFGSPEIQFDALSGSEKRLALIARAAIKPPKVLILDEPTQGLDAAQQARLFDLLQFLSGETSIIFVSHYDEWPPCMNRLLRMPKFSD